MVVLESQLKLRVRMWPLSVVTASSSTTPDIGDEGVVHDNREGEEGWKRTYMCVPVYRW